MRCKLLAKSLLKTWLACCLGSILYGSPIGMLADASLFVPPSSNLEAMRLGRDVSFSETYSFLVTGNDGTGYLKVAAYFSGIQSQNRVDVFGTSASFSATSAAGSFSLFSTGPNQQSQSCATIGPWCTIPFTFGIPFDVVFTAYVSSYYSYAGIRQANGQAPLLQDGGMIRSNAGVSALVVMAPDFLPLNGAEILILPEPSSAVSLATSLLAIALIARRIQHRRRQRQAELNNQVDMRDCPGFAAL